MNVIPKLSLNKHPKDAENLSLVDARNVMISNDLSCITNEESIQENTYIKSYLQNYYYTTDGSQYKIVGIIPCNQELVILACGINNQDKVHIFRYHEKTDTHNEYMYCAYGKQNQYNYFEYSGGDIVGTFTYNVENKLIVAIAESNVEGKDIPLRVLNLGNYDVKNLEDDTYLEHNKISVVPEVRIPKIQSYDYVAGRAYKGWYFFFIRYKINKVDYTQWYSFGNPIYIDDINQYEVLRYVYEDKNKYTNDDNGLSSTLQNIPTAVGFSDFFSDESDICSKTIKYTLNIDNSCNYKHYQLGFICASKTYTKAYKSFDIGINNFSDIELDYNNFEEESVNSLLTNISNYYNVGNITNYKNRLYISNYTEDNVNIDLRDSTSDIISELKTITINNNCLKRDFIICRGNSLSGYNPSAHYKINYNETTLSAAQYFNVDSNTTIKIVSSTTLYNGAANNVYFSINDNVNSENLNITYNNTTINASSIKIVINNNEYTFKWVNAKLGNIYVDNTNFENRLKYRTLIPGEVYNFFIHYIDKYGNATNGFRIKNNIKIGYNDGVANVLNKYPVKIDIKTLVGNTPVINSYYICVNIDDDFIVDGSINLVNYKIFKNFSYNDNKVTFYNEVPTTQQLHTTIVNTFKNQYAYFEDSKYNGIKYYEVFFDNNSSYFLPFINNNNEYMFRVPIRSYSSNSHTVYGIDFNYIGIPDGYIGYFISYEKYESLKKFTGYLTNADFDEKVYTTIGGYSCATGNRNIVPSDTMKFFTEELNIKDSINIDVDALLIEEDYNLFEKEWFYEFDNSNVGLYFVPTTQYKFLHSLNKTQIKNQSRNRLYNINNLKLCVANSIFDNRFLKGSCITMDCSKELFNYFNDDTSERDSKIVLSYKASLYKLSRNLYMNKTKTLIRCSDIIYFGNKDKVHNYSFYNGFFTFNNTIIYNDKGVKLNTANGEIKTADDGEYFNIPFASNTKFANVRPLAYLQIPMYSDICYESKTFNNKPDYISYILGEDTDNPKVYSGTFIEPINSIDLFKLPQNTLDESNPITHFSFNANVDFIEQFDKTIRRSAVIQDESRANGWRTFTPDAYKVITENKGKITNMVGIGTMFLVHTEHSLFMFDMDNHLQTIDKDVQLYSPDTFEVNYQEIFTSDLGYGGLQDNKSWTIDQFGYIFYNNDTNRFYQFDAKQLNIIDTDIIQWLDKYKPYDVRFANDKRNNRLIIKMDYDYTGGDSSIVLSYNYNTKSFISLHDYHFDEAFATKSKLYFKCNDGYDNCSLHQFIKDGTSYGRFDNVNHINNTTYPSKISLLINNSYDDIKYLDYIVYKLLKATDYANRQQNYSPVEETVEPYSGTTIRIFNNLVDTGILNIAINAESNKNKYHNYKKPYYELGNWNFNYLRDIKNADNRLQGSMMSRLYGNYFIVEFTFNNVDERKIEFESLDYGLSR